MTEYWWGALALVLILEGVGPLLFPNKWRAYLTKIAEQPVAQLQQLGGLLVLAGVLLLFIFVS
jgi:uncharacterized protein YjeT (DUF2065 family)